jgi:hypothetical protein
MGGAQRLGEMLVPFVRDEVFVLVGAPVRPLSVEANQLLDLGARRVVIIGDGMGAYEPARRDGMSWGLLDVEAPTISEARAHAVAQLANLPNEMSAMLDELDPHRGAWVINANNMYTGPTVAGRRILGRSRAEWTALEDKTVCDALWDAAGVRHAPHEIVAANRDDLAAAARRLDRGSGTVWAGDARDGAHAGADLTRWVRDDRDVDAVTELIASHCDRARVMPFLEGVPCSIHGVVAIDGVAALRPCEMIVLRDDSPGHFSFVGVGTAWDPDESDRTYMRNIARTVGRLLRERYGFLGTYTVDGILTEDGFLPTELNPRVGGALAVMGAAISEAGLVMHTQFLAHDIDTGVRVADFEELLVAAADGHRQLQASVSVGPDVEPFDQPIVLDAAARPQLAGPGEEHHGVLRSALINSYARSAVVLNIEDAHLPIGPSSAPMVAACLNLADTALGVPLGPYTAAHAIR